MHDKTLEQTLLKARIDNNPTEFMHLLSQIPERQIFSAQFAAYLDAIETLPLQHLFEIGSITPMAGHSLGPHFIPTRKKINEVLDLQKAKLHEGHFPETRQEGGDWYRCDRDPQSIAAMRSMLGNFEEGEVVFSHKGLSDLLGEVIPTFYEPCLEDWLRGKTSICFLGKEFISDQTIIETTLKREINRRRCDKAFRPFTDLPEPTVDSLMLGIRPNGYGLYTEQDIIDFVKNNAAKIQLLHLSHIVFSTGQRLDLHKIVSALKDVIAEHEIIVGVDLAHTTGNRPIDLPSLNITYAAGCAYKFASGSAGTGGFLYVNNKADLKKHQPIQGWVAVEDPSKAFKHIDGKKADNQESITACTNADNQEGIKMCDRGAIAFVRSNPSPIAVAAMQAFAKHMHMVGWESLVSKSECLTRYMIALLKYKLGDKIKFITPEDAEKRGAMIVFQIKGLLDVKPIENLLKEESPLGRFDSDIRPPKNIRLTAQCYISFFDIHNVVCRLTEVVHQMLAKQAVVNKTPAVKCAENFRIFSFLHRSANPVSANETSAQQPIQAKL
ncbi:MAG: aminotransferase class V-fold PLP-dependent enzyme [Legionella sp.]|nr:aminotransferase class V-fold PLP-dependent enzyme [Legionella sp.]